MAIRKDSDFQLLRISQGAYELTHLIDSLSKTSTRRIKSIQMANELLRSSLELQKSLQMLSRLQEASRKMCKKSIKQRVRKTDEEEDIFMAMSSKSYGCYCDELQEPRVSVDNFSTNSVEELKQVIRDRLCKKNILTLKSDNEKVLSNKGLKFTRRKINLSSQTKEIEAPSLIAKLMGLEQFSSGSKDHQKIKQMEGMKEQPEQKSLEEIIETMRIEGILKNDHYDRYKAQPDVHGINFGKDSEVLPIVILKSVDLPPSERGKTTLAELLLEQKTFDHGNYMQVKGNLRSNTEPIQNLSIGADLSLKQAEKEFNMETKKIMKRKNTAIKGKRFTELKEVKTFEAPVYKTSVESTKSEKGKLTAKLNVKAYKSIKQNNKDAMALKANCREKKSREKPVRKFITETETGDQRFEDRKLRSFGTKTPVIATSNSMLITDGLLTHEKMEPIVFDNKAKDNEIVVEVMPRTSHALRNSGLIEHSTKVSNKESTTKPAAKSEHHFKHQLLNRKFFHDYAHGLFEISARIPSHSQARNSEELEVGGEQLLLDSAKELMALKSHERKLSITQMRQPHQRKRSRFLSFNHLLEGISDNGNGIISKNNLYIILEKDLSATWDVGKNKWVGVEEADTVAVEVEKQIISRLIMEVAMDLVDLE